MTRFRRRSAFTLIEILVVLLIISILSALLFAVFARVREKGRAASCQSNLRQLALAVQQYTADNNTYPSWYNEYKPTNPLPNNYLGIPWGVRVMPYVKNQSIFQCPSDPYPATSDPIYIYTQIAGFTDYGYNLNLSDLPDSKVNKSSEVVLLFDNGSGPAYIAQSGPPFSRPTANGDIHNGGANYAFTDGHIKWLRPDKQNLFEVQSLFEIK